MSSDAQVLREYLVSLGFKIDGAGQKKFDVGLGKLDLTAKGLTKSLIGVATTAQVMVGIFANQMEKLYYSAKKADSTVSSMQAMEFAAKNVGISGDAMRQSIEGMARAMRSNPGLQGLLKALHVESKGRDKADVMLDLVTQLKQMPFAVAERYASMFGIDSDQLFLMMEGLDKMKEAAALRKKMSADVGFDPESASKAGLEYARMVTEITTRLNLLKDVASVAMLPFFRDASQGFIGFLSDLTKVIGKIHSIDELVTRFSRGASRLWGSITGKGAEANAKPPSIQNQPLPSSGAGAGRGGPPGGPPSTNDIMAQRQKQLSALEQKYGLPAGLLDRVWMAESGRGSNVGPSKAGAMGDFQFMPSTAKEFGVDVSSFESSADGAARKLAGLQKYYKGDLRKAVSAYNVGEGNLDKHILGQRALPDETQAYADKIMGPGTIQQTNTITVNGVSDPGKAAKEVERAMQTANADLTRNNIRRVR